MSDPFAFNRPAARGPGAAAAPPPDWSSWGTPVVAGGVGGGGGGGFDGGLPTAGSLGTIGAPPAPAPATAAAQPAWGSFVQPPYGGGAGGQPAYGGQHQQQHHHQQQQQQFGAGPQFNPAALAEMANNPMAQLGMKYGREIVESSLQRYMPGASGLWNSLRYYFHINNSYVKNKLRKVLFPFSSRNFVRVLAAEAGLHGGGGGGGSGSLGSDGSGGDGGIAGPAMAGVSPYAAPVHDENAPDLYIPLMAFITFVLISGLLQGTKMTFTPEVLVTAMSQSTVTTVLEVVGLKAGLYFIAAEGCPFLDLVCYAGYKYVGLCINTLVGLFGGPTAYYVSLLYTASALGYFMVNTLMPVVRPENYRAAHVPQLPGGGAGSRLAEAQKNYFVLAAGGAQFLLLWWLGPKL